MKKLLLALSLFALAFGFTQTVPFDPGETLPTGPYATERVIDGDTFTVLQDVPVTAPVDAVSGGAMSGGAMSGGAPTTAQVERSVRVLGIDTPEMHPLQPFAQEATDLANTLLAGKVTTLEVSEADRYGRALARVTLDTGQDFALLMLQSGYAELRADADFLPQLPVYQAGLAGAESVGKGLWEGTPFRDRNCGAFATYAEAQAFFEGAATPAKPDPHRLDGNKDGIVCLNLP